MGNMIEKHKAHWADKRFLWSVIGGVLLLLFSMILGDLAVNYAIAHQSNYVTDIILSNVPAFDVDWIFALAPIILITFVAIILFFEPKRIPFVFKTVATFWIIRSFFITFTHIAPFPVRSEILSDSFLRLIGSGTVSDLFFSGHAGLPFLMSLIFWDKKGLRMTFLLASIFLGIIVLLGHLHYSIDVFAAYFIAYSIFALSKRLFAKDYELFHKGLGKRKSNA